MVKAIELDCGWREEALRARERRQQEEAAMRELSNLIEKWIKEEMDLPLVLLAFHHVAMAHGSYAQKKTLAVALKSSIEELSKVAPNIFPPGRVVRIAAIKRIMQNA